MIAEYLKSTAFFFFIMLFLPVIANAGEIKSTKSSEHVSNKLLVKFCPGATDEEKVSIRKRLGAELVKSLKEIRVEVWKLPEGLSVEDAIEKLKDEKSVEYSEPEYIYKPQSLHGNSGFYNQRHLNKTCQAVNGISGESEAEISALRAEDIEIGSSNITIAMIDTGLAIEHPDLVVLKRAIDTCLEIFDSDGRVMSACNRLAIPLTSILRGQEIIRFVSRLAMFPLVTFSRLVTCLGFIFFIVTAVLGYLLPSAIFFIMAREKEDEDDKAPGK